MNASKNESITAEFNASLPESNAIEMSTQIGMIAAYSIIFLLALSGNGLIIHIVVSKPYMRSTINFLIANMAAADLMMTLFAMPYTIYFLYFGSQWFGGVLGNLTCKAVHFTIGLSIAASISTLIVISLDRFFAIVYPFRRSSVIKKIPITITTTWVTSALLLSPYLYIYKVQLKGGYMCMVSIGDNSMKSLGIYHAITFGVLYIIPLTLIAAFYFAVCRKLWLRKIPGNPSAMNLRSANKSKKRTIKMLIIIVVVFALCWLPAHVMHIIIFFNYDAFKKFPQYASLLAFFFSHANSAINPLLYITLNKNFMHAFIDITEKLQLWRTSHSTRRTKSLTTTSLTNLSVIVHENQIIMSFRSSPTGRIGRYNMNGVEESDVIESLKKATLVSASCISKL
ncbi:allatostatin-A receptor-like [Exaiptasia diaphana]|uniref:G-protein coupled receptors family 1 profile domain-containing protein n=1 Tax=Exaiptasia diaphana TaxID=2652724 RepID=A0A913YF28_EXADI|nr:allatostatin-A receptor-like [Exaiptasia diaphana]XP_028513940.1 allatostatin-A receptor-like [Exaiptasia diaphana]